MDQNNSHWPFKTNEPNFEFELILWKLETLHVKIAPISLDVVQNSLNFYWQEYLLNKIGGILETKINQT